MALRIESNKIVIILVTRGASAFFAALMLACCVRGPIRCRLPLGSQSQWTTWDLKAGYYSKFALSCLNFFEDFTQINVSSRGGVQALTLKEELSRTLEKEKLTKSSNISIIYKDSKVRFDKNNLCEMFELLFLQKKGVPCFMRCYTFLVYLYIFLKYSFFLQSVTSQFRTSFYSEFSQKCWWSE